MGAKRGDGGCDSERSSNTSSLLSSSSSLPGSVTVQTLTRSAWPASVQDSLPVAVSLPLQAVFHQYQQFYAARHPTRHLSPHWDLTRVALKASFPSPKESSSSSSKKAKMVDYELHVTGAQATLLHAFKKRKKSGLTLADFARQFGFPTPLHSALQEEFVAAVLATFTFQRYKTPQDLPSGCSKAFPLITCLLYTSPSPRDRG